MNDERLKATTPPAWLHRVLAAGETGRLRGERPPASGGDARASAVLMLFGPAPEPRHPDDVDVVLTQRADTLRKHAGQVSFPGGGVEEQDASFTDTALREAHEEIGLDRSGVEVLGELAPVALTVTNFDVTPVLAWWNVPHDITALDPIEVARVARVRVSDLVDPAHRFTVTHPRGFEGPAFEVDGLYIWGFTAFLLDAVLTAGGVARPWNVDDRRQVAERFLR